MKRRWTRSNLLAERAKLYPERVAVIDGDSRWTYAQFLDRCDLGRGVAKT